MHITLCQAHECKTALGAGIAGATAQGETAEAAGQQTAARPSELSLSVGTRVLGGSGMSIELKVSGDGVD